MQAGRKKERKNEIFRLGKRQVPITSFFIGLAYQGKDIVFGFIIEYSSLRDFGP